MYVKLGAVCLFNTDKSEESWYLNEVMQAADDILSRLL